MRTLDRKTQEERSAETQGKLLDATISCLITNGYNSITTTKVSRIAKMSQGSIFKHYATKQDLVAAAIAKLYDQLIETYEFAIEFPPPESDKIKLCLTALWALFESPALLAVYDLHTAARTDSELKSALEPFERRHRAKIRQTAARIFPELSENPRFLMGIDIIINVVQGAAISRLALEEPEVEYNRQQTLEDLTQHILETLHE
tara:strand:+ start:559 stop:1170 length:612 start_codon:yes stop_codon:yes gene_type:complete